MSWFIEITCEDLFESEYSRLRIPKNSQAYQQSSFDNKFAVFSRLLQEKFTKSKSRPECFQQKLEQTEVITSCAVFERQIGTTEFNDKSKYSICSKVRMNSQTLTIEVHSSILKNGFPIQPKSRQFRLLLCRYLNKLNATLRDGQFQFNPFNGHIAFRISNILSYANFCYLIYNPHQGFSYIQSEMQASLSYIRFNIGKILYILQDLCPFFMKMIQSSGESIKSFESKQSIQRLELIQKAINLSTFEFDFMFQQRINDYKPHQSLQKVQRSKKGIISSTRISLQEKKKLDTIKGNLSNFNQSVTVNKTSYKEITNYIRQHEERLIKHLCFTRVKPINRFQRTGVYSLIYIFQNEKIKWQLVGEGGFSHIKKAQCILAYLNDIQKQVKREDQKNAGNVFKRILARKIEKDQRKESKLKHQKEILKLLKYKRCVNILRFYETQQNHLKEDLLMDYCIFRSLDTYRKLNNCTLSQLTKLYLLSQIVEGLRFLRDHKIIHFDVKPQNMLICRGLILKITDFGESYHPDINKEDYRPGFTLPYTAPQVFYAIIPFEKKEKFDIYSLGVVMYETLFDSFPIELRRIKMSQMMVNYQQPIEVANGIPQNSETFGPQRLMENLCLLSLKCLSKQAEKRPSLDWIQIILRQSITYLQSLY